ncbi:hypothetical protein CC86DRAFT_467490 [Ophiobolus disseminans]|uniref:ADF-H domain-containing protein n=1 Tax=Ophiobolus disseminans TaxID=1469910 RepID=A0A6A6ZXV8_9PLEO|nr:hypothetical protein CC86DRAFT_467490 [Ophiobolus disseminans]
MSLNGLDDVSVTQAYQGAIAEAGGWFLLKYTSRDAVAVLTRGTGGAGEARVAVAQYEEKSPLYGFMLYRRRKVLVKYVPDGTSRLLQARVAVHFITVTERFAPHDIVLAITTPEELSDAALTAACKLHTAAPSSSSSSGSSSRQQKLSWIQEAAEEGSQQGGDDSTTSRPVTARSNIPTIIEPPVEEMPERNMSVISDGAESVPLILEEKVPEAKTSPNISHVTIETVTEAPTTPDSDLADMQETLKSYDKLFEGGPEPRSSSQTARPNYDELYEHYYAQYSKPKVKLGPRPRPSLDGKRPSTSGSVPQVASRPKSSLPAGLRSATKKAADQRAAKPRDRSTPPTLAIPPPPPIPMTPDAPSSPMSLAFTARSPASVRSMPVSGYSSHYRSLGNTQEKTRLMKALELRKKQMKAQVERQEQMAEQATAKAEADAEANIAEDASTDGPTPENESVAPMAETDSGKSFNTAEVKAEDDLEEVSSVADDDPALEKSGLVFSGNHTDTDDLNSSASVSSPISAQTQGSSGAPSTRPSSISDDDTPAQEETTKSEDAEDSQGSDVVDEEQSVDSMPTVVPEQRTPIPSLIHSSPFDDDSNSGNNTDTLGLSVPAAQQNDAASRRRSKRESTLFVPSGEASPLDDSMFKKRNRESVIMPNSKRQSWYETKEKRRPLLDPLQVSAENSEAEYLSDDSFMEELQSATVHEAKPMSVSKSPITPWFSRKASDSSMATTPERSVSHAYVKMGRPSPEQLSRKTSGPWPPQVTADKNVGVAKKINVSSGISQRIKALAEKSNRESSSSPPATPVGGLSTPSSSLAQRKSSFFATPSVETSPNGRSITRLGAPSFLGSSASSTPDKRSVTPKPIKATVYNVNKANQKPESVQVTARIVRDERTKRPTLAMPNESTPLDLHQSPLIIDHQKPSWSPKSPTRGRTEPASPKAPSTSHSRDPSNGPPRTSSESTWKAFGRRMSESRSIHSHDGEEKRDEKKDKKESRTSKMFKRMSSSMASMPWKNSGSNLTLPENDMRTTSLSSLREPPPPVHVGDLNIQFPDTLLWRRRWVEIDSVGNLVLSPSKSNEKGIVKRFHLTEFRTPYPPDQDRQELPNSVVLDFIDGRTLQCACETYIAQAHVLQILREAHDAWLAYSQAI